MKKLTIRIDDYMYNRLHLTAEENKISVNKIVSSIVKQYIDQPREVNYLKELDEKLNIISKRIDSISKKQSLHFNVSSQHFANHAYLSNANLSEDKCLQDILKKNKNYYE